MLPWQFRFTFRELGEQLLPFGLVSIPGENPVGHVFVLFWRLLFDWKELIEVGESAVVGNRDDVALGSLVY